jgi:hypothetical protein
VAEQAAAFARHVVGDVDRFLDVAGALLEHLAHLLRHDAAELAFALLQQLAETKQILGALGRRLEPPAGEGLPGGFDGHGHFARAGLVALAHQLAGGGIGA